MKIIILLSIVALFFLTVVTKNPPRQIDFHHLTPPKTPNYFLLCPKHFCQGLAHATSPVFSVNIDELERQWQTFIAAQPRVTEISRNQANHQYTYIQRTRFLYFPDTINVLLIPLDETHTTIAVLSQSKYGYSDLGVNHRRVETWITKLQCSMMAK